MVLDAIIAFFGSLIGFFVAGIVSSFIPIANIAVALVEAVVGFFLSGFRLKRIQVREDLSSSRIWLSRVFVLVVLLGVASCFIFVPKIKYREVAFVAQDGYSVPYAGIVIHTKKKSLHRRTDNAGNILIPRFGVAEVVIKDPRYVEQVWDGAEITSELTVVRTKLGSGLDGFANRFLKTAK